MNLIQYKMISEKCPSLEILYSMHTIDKNKLKNPNLKIIGVANIEKNEFVIDSLNLLYSS